MIMLHSQPTSQIHNQQKNRWKKGRRIFTMKLLNMLENMTEKCSEHSTTIGVNLIKKKPRCAKNWRELGQLGGGWQLGIADN